MISSERLVRSEHLVVRCKQGDTAAMSELIEVWVDPMYYYVRRFNLSEEESMDVIQTCGLELSRNSGNYENQRL